MTIETTDIDTSHDIFEAFLAVGYDVGQLYDPGQVTAEDVEDGDWRVVRLTGHGIEMFDVDDAIDTGRDEPYQHAVEFGRRDVQQPIGFADAAGPLNDRLNENGVEAILRHDLPVPFLVDRDSDPEYPSFTRGQAVRALAFWGSEGWIPEGTAHAMVEAFGGTADSVYTSDDQDVDGLEIARAPDAAQKMASAAGIAKSSDDGITGHKKRRRQTFHRNLDALRDHVGADE